MEHVRAQLQNACCPNLRSRTAATLRALGGLVLGLVVTGGPLRGEVIGDVARAGYPLAGGLAVRTGTWVPVVVDLSLQNQAAFDGFLRLRQVDRDGDVYTDSVPVHLFADTGAQNRYWLYAIPNNSSPHGMDVFIELLEGSLDDPRDAQLVKMTSAGRPVSHIEPPGETTVLSDDDYLLLSLSQGALGRIRHLADDEYADRFARHIQLAHLSPDGLPNHWFGLEMVDCIVWDDADATQISDLQRRALLDWVRQGGRLMLAAARTADTLAASDLLGPVLPVEVGPVQSLQSLPETRKRLLNRDDPDYLRPIPVATCALRPGENTRCLLREPGAAGPVVSTRRLGYGHITYVAASLNDLLSESPDPYAAVQFFTRTLELRHNVVTEDIPVQPINLFRYLDEQTGFYQRSGVYLTIALLFAVGYVLAATFGMWKLLGARRMLHHSWTALAVTALLASGVSIAGVQTIRGVGKRVHQLAVIDGQAGSIEARATAYFGLTTAVHSKVDVWLPADYLRDRDPGPTSCSLKPMVGWMEGVETETGFTDPARYEIWPATAEIRDVPLRATLKQFEGRWQGQLPGSVLANLRSGSLEFAEDAGAESRIVRITVLTEDSWIENNLGVDLSDCYLLHAEKDTFTSYFGDNSPRAQGQGHLISVHHLGTLPQGQRVVLNGLYRKRDGARLTAAELAGRSLRSVQESAVHPFLNAASLPGLGGGGPTVQAYAQALFLLTTLSDYDPLVIKNQAWGGMPMVSRARCRQHDLSDLLRADTAILVGRSGDPGPLRLCARTGRAYAPIEPEASWTVYRFTIPVAGGRAGSTEMDLPEPGR